MIFVTGGTGLLGAQLLLDLAKAGKKVRAMRRASGSMYVVNLLFAEHPQLLQNIEWVEGDVTDVFSVSEAMQDVKEVYHCAGKISFLPSDNEQMMKVNAEGTANMVNMALEAGVEKFCHVSSVAALGRVEENTTIDENFVWKASKNNSNYAVSKYCGEREVWRATEEGLNAVIVNPTVIIGPGDWKSGSSLMFGQVWKGFPFYTEGINGFVDVGDVSKCMISLMEKNCFHQRFIIVSENLSYRNVFTKIAESLHKSPPTIRVSKFLSEAGWRIEALRSFILRRKPFITKETANSSQHQWFYVNDKVRKELGIEFLPVKESIEKTAALFLNEFVGK